MQHWNILVDLRATSASNTHWLFAKEEFEFFMCVSKKSSQSPWLKKKALWVSALVCPALIKNCDPISQVTARLVWHSFAVTPQRNTPRHSGLRDGSPAPSSRPAFLPPCSCWHARYAEQERRSTTVPVKVPKQIPFLHLVMCRPRRRERRQLPFRSGTSLPLWGGLPVPRWGWEC